MGLVELAAENLTVKRVALIVVGAVVLNYFVSRIVEHVKIKRLGNYGRQLRSYAPFGEDSPLAERAGALF